MPMKHYNYAKILHNLIKVHVKPLHACSSSTKCKHKITNWKLAASSWGKPERVADQTNFIACMFVQEKLTMIELLSEQLLWLHSIS